jgi:hypothetical protein
MGPSCFKEIWEVFPNLLPEAEFNKQKEEAGEVGQICLLSGVRKLGKPPKKLRSKKLGFLWPFDSH